MKLVLAIILVTQTAIAFNKPVLIDKGTKAPFQGLLLDPETMHYVDEKINRIDGCESALVKQNDYLIDTQVKIVTLEFERDNARAKAKETTMVSGFFWIIAGILIGSAGK